MRANRGTDTGPERALRSYLHRSGHRFRKHERVIPTLRCNADILFRGARVAVFVDGCYWHRCPAHGTWPKANREWWREKFAGIVARDRRNDIALSEAGWTVVRVWEHEAPEDAAVRIEAALAHARAIRGTPDY